MKPLLLFITLFFLTFVAFSQTNNTLTKPMGTVQYQFISKWEKKVYAATLQFNPQASLYFYGRTKDGTEKRTLNETDPNNTVLDIADKEGWTNYQDFQTKQLISRDLIWAKFAIVTEKMPELNWKMTESLKKIGNFDCQEAVCSFRGRTYHAWFTMEIPVGSGPWKLSGLPGLILEAYDENKEYQFVFIAINMPANDTTPIVAPLHGLKKSTWEEFNIGRKKKLEDVMKSITAEMNADGNNSVKYEVHSLEAF